ncbi:MAG: ArsI/CadI family heavy metal resistance metalloenzyme [Pseudomonadota bacterium]
MKRLHVSVGVADLEESLRFYSALFGAEPTLVKTDYAKWMLDDPRVNFAITTREGGLGVGHLGIQSETQEELVEVFGRVADTGRAIFDEGDTSCCYANSTKQWVDDPQGVVWETFQTHEQVADFGATPKRPEACCQPSS